ncbi:MAG: hypothetical protein J5666_02265 [Bacilli bacterium]|nr:hypothetical protein [Bacilli bacterium]
MKSKNNDLNLNANSSCKTYIYKSFAMASICFFSFASLHCNRTSTEEELLHYDNQKHNLRFALQENEEGNNDQNKEVDETRILQSSTFKYRYFINMIDNFGNNDVGSCGYVAMAMLLTYFDTYWDDNIVPSDYEVSGSMSSLDVSYCFSSPGTNREECCPTEYLPFYDSSLGNDYGVPNNYSNYKNWIYTNYYNNSLHTKLIIDYLGVNTPYGPGVGPSTFSSVFSEYFSSINYSDYYYIRSPVGATSAEVKSWVIDQIVNHDRPVILGRAGHVAIAYDYNSAYDIVYVHNGWLNSTHAAFYYDFDDAHTLVFTGNHNHSNNYIYENQSYCHCQLNSHYHKYSYLIESDIQHCWICYCGAYGYENHNFVPVLPLYLMLFECDKCGIRKIIEGGFGQ